MGIIYVLHYIKNTFHFKFKDNVLRVAFGNTPIVVIITTEQISQTYRNFFNAMWKIAKKL